MVLKSSGQWSRHSPGSGEESSVARWLMVVNVRGHWRPSATPRKRIYPPLWVLAAVQSQTSLTASESNPSSLLSALQTSSLAPPALA